MAKQKKQQSLRLLKLIVTPIVAQYDDKGQIIGEQAGDPIVVYTKEQAEALFVEIPKQLKQMEA